jgi:hypothetical protein
MLKVKQMDGQPRFSHYAFMLYTCENTHKKGRSSDFLMV